MHCLDALFQDGTILRVNSLRASIKAARRSIRGGCAPQYLVRHLDSVAAAAHEHKEWLTEELLGLTVTIQWVGGWVGGGGWGLGAWEGWLGDWEGWGVGGWVIGWVD